jgi:hypothetical protein
MDLSTLYPSQFKWNDIHQKAFESMIDAIQTHTSLNLPDPSKPFFVQTDASDVAGAGRVFRKTTKVMNYLWLVFPELLPE